MRNRWFLSLLCLIFSACTKTEPALVEQRPAYQPTPTAANSTQLNLPKVIAPKPHEVQEAVKRVFKDVAVLEASANPNFIVGDFNGDASQDLAVVLKPAPGKLEAINEVYPPWLLRDPFSKASGGRQLHIDENETLLAVIHGYGANDWRDSQATQTFLLKNSAGKDLQTKSSADFMRANSGRRLPRMQGDVISEAVSGIQGCLYFVSATYRWYDPKTFQDEINAPATVHGRNGQMGK